MKKHILTLLLFAITAIPAFCKPAADFYNIKQYGAVGDGKNLDSKAINKAIDAAAAKGGGTVFIPAGNYLSGSIHLKSNISLYLDQGATIIAAPLGAENGYDDEEPGANNKYQDSGHSHWHNSLIWGEDLHDISILGQGMIWGKGLVKDYIKGKQTANKAISLLRCRNVNIRDISVLHGGWFAILATGVDNLTIDNVKLDTNRDGMDIDCCKNVRVSNCYVNSPGDDGICLKSTFGLGYARSTDNVTITNCQVSGYEEGSLLDGTFKRSADPNWHPTGRIKLGTESNGGFKNITISNCVFDYCRGLALETVDGALLEDIAITNITMRDVVNDPIFIRLGARMRGPKDVPVGQLRRVIISNVMVYNADPAYTCTISGIPGHDIEDVQLNNIRIYYKGGITNGQPQRDVPEKADQYPEPGQFGQAPAYGFFIRHAKAIKMNNVQVSLLNADNRPAFRLDDVKGFWLNQVTADKNTDGKLILMNDVTGVQAFQSLDFK
ncbi:Pectate lyase superfamily protein [Mucilaginibacter pineti]|uniref:Pectate lyase superfamily protein n=1 Tax=Mucilaginibacter pineti TaxID=1391627 RepID=A0A1G6YYF8_9SPHI|nr:glycoside hydrolase family 28 protein [Mucilaginibacter pineti]SDD95429.1 Pectate lyase superfamily protein [Mucilaginibacter pineti]